MALFPNHTSKRRSHGPTPPQFGRIVPSLWMLEVASVLLVAERRGRLTAEQSLRCVELLGALPVFIQPADATDVFATTIPLARDCGLTLYDATYLELCLRRGLPLATLDEKLRAAAGRLGSGGVWGGVAGEG
ncbi:MAG: type II toxin-antitoxin system VapC family toxin [Candidatus Sumerlaeaceae bacterium]|nr:type II toxin-antitoxin system VapC family toxin [Candidatus Sumerlaeaceae bacterium]